MKDSLCDLLAMDDVIMIIPGLHEKLALKKQKRFAVITFGRLDPENDRIKQVKLAVAAFSSAIKYAKEDKSRPECLRSNPMLWLFGINESGEMEEELLKKFATQQAGRAINLIALPYTEKRDDLFDTLSTCSLALMLSWHEGFGLTGWEAISSEVPLIISEQSGLFQFIHNELGGLGTGCIHTVPIDGNYDEDEDPINYTESTLEKIRSTILECARNRETLSKDAKALKTLLIDKGYTWAGCARKFAEALGISKPISHGGTFAPSEIFPKDFDINKFTSITRSIVCLNQGEYIQYSFLAAEFHKKIKKVLQQPYLEPLDTRRVDDLCKALSNFLNRNLERIAKENFGTIKQYFKGRHMIEPRICVKGSQLKEGHEWIVDIFRDENVEYKSDYKLGSNSGFVHVKETGTFFQCPNIPEAIASGYYKNLRIDQSQAKEYWKLTEQAKNSDNNHNDNIKNANNTIDIEWIKCWCHEKNVTNETNSTSCYKSTLIIPMTLWNVALDPEFRKLIGTTEINRTIFGFLCFDHVAENFFLASDVDLGYIVADILSKYFITRAIYTDFSKTYVRALDLADLK